MPWPLYHWGNSPGYPIAGWVRPRAYGHGGKEKKIPAPARNQTPVVQLKALFLYL